MRLITSVQNDLIKNLAKLKDASARRKNGMFIIEGEKLCFEAVRCNLEIAYCIISENAIDKFSYLTKHCSTAVVFLASAHVIKKISSLTSPQQIIMIARIPEPIISNPPDVILALDNISDPLNLGALLRCCEAFGVTHILAGDGTADAYSPKVLRGSMGSALRVNIQYKNLADELSRLKKSGYDIIGAAMDTDAISIDKFSPPSRFVIVIGNEGAGISRQVSDLCQHNVIIPMCGDNESLNAAVAASIILWEISKKRFAFDD